MKRAIHRAAATVILFLSAAFAATPTRAHHLPRVHRPGPAATTPPTDPAAPAPPSSRSVSRVYIANDDHSDYMWTADDMAYRAAFLNMLDHYQLQADATAGNPPGLRGRFVCDGTIWFWEYERYRTPAEVDALVGHIRAGDITLPLNALVQLYGAMPAEAVIRSFLYAGQIQRRYDLDLPLVVPMENQTLPGGVGSLWAGCGARYAWKGICDCATQIDAANRPREIYRFAGPDGQSVIMKWNSSFGFGNQSIGGYAEARDPATAVGLLTWSPTFLSRWPYTVAAAFGHGWDDLQTTTDAFVTTAIDSSTAGRPVVVSNEVDFFEDFDATHGAQLTNFGGSFGNEWELLTASMGEATAKVKRSVETLRTAEALASVATLYDPAFMTGREADRDSAMLSCGLYFEHSWTPGPGVNESTRAAWQRKIQQAISRYADDLLADAGAAVAARVAAPGGVERHAVFNPLSWSRTDFADLNATLAAPRHVVDVTTGLEVPSQAVTIDGQPRLRILASNVPPVGYRVYEVVTGAGQGWPASATVTLPAFENAFYRVTAGSRGQITSLLDKKDGNRQLVLSGGAIHDLGNGSGSVTLENSGPVSTTLRVVAGGTPAHETRVTLYAAPVDRIDIEGKVTQNFGSNVGYTSRLDLAGGLWRHEEVGMVARVARQSAGGDYADQNARTDYLTLNHFADLSQAGRGVTISSRDSQFFKVGNSTPTTLDASSTTFRAAVGMQVDGAGMGISGQGGDSSFLDRFGLMTHGAFDPAASMRMSLEHQNPLVGLRVSGAVGAPLPADRWSLLSIDGSDILLWSLKPAEDGASSGLVARAWNIADSPRSFTLHVPGWTMAEAWKVTHIETDLAAASHTDTTLTDFMARQQMKSWRLRLTPAASGAPEGGAAGRRLALAVHPNPGGSGAFRAIRFTLPAAADIRIDLFDLSGRRVESILSERRGSGVQEVRWRPAGHARGIYFLQVRAGGEVERTRVIVE